MIGGRREPPMTCPSCGGDYVVAWSYPRSLRCADCGYLWQTEELARRVVPVQPPAKSCWEAEQAVVEADKIIAARCEALGIPREFAPGISFGWHGRGHNAVTNRRVELRRAAKSKIEALEAAAISAIEKISLQSQTELLTQGLETDSARLFLNSMPNMQTLMPSVQVADMQALLDTAAKREIAYLN